MKKTLLTAGVIAIFITIALIPACTSTETRGTERGTEITPILDDPDVNKTFWGIRYLLISELKDPVFTYDEKSPGTYVVDEYGQTKIEGLFFNVKITGTIGNEDCLEILPMISFLGRVFLRYPQGRLGIQVGDTVEISAPILSTKQSAGSPFFGVIDEDGLHIRPAVIKPNLKAYY